MNAKIAELLKTWNFADKPNGSLKYPLDMKVLKVNGYRESHKEIPPISKVQISEPNEEDGSDPNHHQKNPFLTDKLGDKELSTPYFIKEDDSSDY